MTRPSKYGNVKTVVDGITFDSKAEAWRYAELKFLVRAKEIGDLKLQPKYQLLGKGLTKICSYIADFQYVELAPDGYVKRMVVEDVKGVRTPVYRLKAKLFKDNFGFEITEVRA